jgi:hypothetical protein
MSAWNGPTPVTAVADEIEAMADDEVVVLATPHGLGPIERARTLGDVQALADELRRRGHVPIVEVRHTPAGELHAISIDRGER